MWKDFLYFTKNERIGTLVLIGLIAAAMIVRMVIIPYIESKNTAQPLPPEYAKQVAALAKNMEGSNHQLKKFNPCQSDSSSFSKLGIKEKDIKYLIDLRHQTGNDETYIELFIEWASENDPELLPYIKIEE